MTKRALLPFIRPWIRRKEKDLKPVALFFFAVVFSILFIAVFARADSGGDELRIPIAAESGTNLPEGWKVKEWKGKAEFAVMDTEIGKTLSLKSEATSTALYREVSFDIRQYPVLRWKWKVARLPKGADVRSKSTDDQAIQLYVVFPKFPAVANSRVVGYIWDTGAPEGAVVQSTKSSRTRYIVLKSGDKGLGQWFEEKRNVYEDYKELFKEEPPHVGRVSVMIDSDDTKSSAESFIGDIYFSKE